MSARLLELLDERLLERAEDHVRSAYPCRTRDTFCLPCNPHGAASIAPSDRVANFITYERAELVRLLCKLLDDGFVTPDDLRDTSDG